VRNKSAGKHVFTFETARKDRADGRDKLSGSAHEMETIMKYSVVAMAMLVGQFAALVADAKDTKYYPHIEDRRMSATHPGALSPRTFYSGGRASWDQVPQTSEPERGTSANGS
jgi:hypothetical protein